MDADFGGSRGRRFKLTLRQAAVAGILFAATGQCTDICFIDVT
jgi:hypothetical protein